MDANEHIESLQAKYTEALLSGNSENEQKIREEIDLFLEKGEVPSPVTSPEDSTNPLAVGEETEQTPTSSEPSAEVAVKDDTSTQAEPKEATQNWLDSLSPEVKANVEKLIQQNQQLDHQYKSVNGRLAAYQRRYEDTQKEAVKLKQQLTAMPQGPSAAKTPTLNKIEDDPDLKQLAETDEQLARVILKQRQETALREEELRKKIEQLESKFNPLEQQFTRQSQYSELEKLKSYVPNAEEIFRHPAWDEWVNAQPRGVQTLANSDYADDVARAIELYGQDMQRIYGNVQKPAQQQQSPTVDPRVEEVRKERERKLQAQPVGSPASVRPPQRSEPTLEEIASNPELLEKFQAKIMQDELKKMGRG